MITHRKAEDRGHSHHGWLDTWQTFSFADYLDPGHVRFRALRVMNEDRISPGKGFGTHPHHDMEIVTYVLSGALEHRDSMGNGQVLRPGEFQRMSAGTGITHSEFNPSDTEPVHLYQIWLFPARKGLDPGYEQRRFDQTGRINRLQLVASPTAEQSSLTIHQDAKIYLADLGPGHAIHHELNAQRHTWIQVLKGSLTVNELSLSAGDGVAISGESGVTLSSTDHTEIMLFDLA